MKDDLRAVSGYFLSRGLLTSHRRVIIKLLSEVLDVSHTLTILQDQVKFYKNELLKLENAKQFHLKNMKEAASQQNNVQEVIDDLYKTIDKLNETHGS